MVEQTFWSFGAKGMGFIGFYATNIFLARFLGIETFGLWSLFFSILSILLVLSRLGLGTATQRYVAQYNHTEYLKPLLCSSIWLRIVSTAVVSLCLFPLAQPLAQWLHQPLIGQLILYSVPLVFISGLVEFLKSIFTGLHALKYSFIITSSEYLLKLVLVVTLLTSFGSLDSVILAYTIALLLTCMVGYYLLDNRFDLPGSSSTIRFIGELVNYSKILFIISVGFLIASEIDVIMIGLYCDDKEIGTYAGAKQLVTYLPHISVAIAAGTMAPFAKLNRINKEKLKLLFERLILINTLIFLPIILGILLFSDSIILLLLGSDYIGSSKTLVLLTPFIVAGSFLTLFGTFLDYQGLASKRAKNMVVTILLNIMLNMLLIPRYGSIGAAAATSLSYVPYALLNYIEVRKVWKTI